MKSEAAGMKQRPSGPSPTSQGAMNDSENTGTGKASNGNFHMGAIEWAMLVGLAVVWGSSFFFSKVALRDLPPFTIVWVRSVLGALFLWFIVRLGGQSMRLPWRVWRDFAVLGVLNSTLPFSLISYGQTQIASGLASILNATSPLFTVLVAHFATRDERFSIPKLVGIAFGIAGVAVMIGVDALRGLGLNVLAQVAVLIASFSYACGSVYGRRVSGLPAMVAACGPIVCGAFILAPFALIIDRPWELAMPGAATWGAMAGLVVLCTAVSYFFYFRILAVAGATNLMLVTFLIPISALLLGVIVLDEVIELQHLGGMALICVGLAAIDGRVLRLLRPQ